MAVSRMWRIDPSGVVGVALIGVALTGCPGQPDLKPNFDEPDVSSTEARSYRVAAKVVVSVDRPDSKRSSRRNPLSLSNQYWESAHAQLKQASQRFARQLRAHLKEQTIRQARVDDAHYFRLSAPLETRRVCEKGACRDQVLYEATIELPLSGPANLAKQLHTDPQGRFMVTLAHSLKDASENSPEHVLLRLRDAPNAQRAGATRRDTAAVAARKR
ncbi:MAG: hypothetical protein H6707_07310 [Deltaproteobacteria bacterium]|nr:hypothetical protein [Myxococcales bacterium]MCB9555894.1 hypothetical protein [Deltaproteobacteria bacterium]